MNTGYFYHHYSCLEIEEYKIGPSFRWPEDGGTLKDIVKSGEISDLWWKKSVNSFLEESMTFLNTSAVYSVSIHVEVFYVDIFSMILHYFSFSLTCWYWHYTGFLDLAINSHQLTYKQKKPSEFYMFILGRHLPQLYYWPISTNSYPK